jgi:hypothetical protein
MSAPAVGVMANASELEIVAVDQVLAAQEPTRKACFDRVNRIAGGRLAEIAPGGPAPV